MPLRDLTYLCEAAEIPGRGFMSSDLRYYGPSFKIPYQSSYEDINMTFLVRDRFEERRFFDNWMEIINPSTNYDFEYRRNYLGEIHIFQMSDIAATVESQTPGDDPVKNSQRRYAIALRKAYPVLVNPQPMTWADDNFHRLTVTFTYTRWNRFGIDDNYSQREEYQLVQDAYNYRTGGNSPIPDLKIT